MPSELQTERAQAGALPASKTILLVDDEVAIRNLYHLYFESHGYRVVCAASVAEALRHFRTEPVSIAVVDIFLGEDNGLDLLKGIVAARPALPVIVISGIGRDQSPFEEAQKHGAAGVFSKTEPLERLLHQISQLSGS